MPLRTDESRPPESAADAREMDRSAGRSHADDHVTDTPRTITVVVYERMRWGNLAVSPTGAH